MSTPMEANTEALREILQQVNELPEAGSVATDKVFIATRATTFSELHQQYSEKACFFSNEEGFIYPLVYYDGGQFVFSGVSYDLKELDRYVIRDDGKGFVYESRKLSGYPDWSHLKWYVMGDSLTDPAGIGHTSKFYYEYVREKTGIQVIVDGLGGTGYYAGVSTGTNFVERVKNIPADVDVVTIFGSGNDIVHGYDNYAQPISATMAYFYENRPGLPVIIIPPSPWNGYNKRGEEWKAYCDRLELVALNYSLHYASKMWTAPPFDPNSSAARQAFFTKCADGVHPDENGHRALAPYFYNALLQELALKV